MKYTSISLLLVAVFLSSAHAIVFNVPLSDKKCVAEEVPKDVLVVGNYEAFQAYNVETDMQIFDPNQRQVYMKRNIEKGKFAFTATETGDHTICFVNRVPEGMAQAGAFRKVRLEVKQGVDARDYSDVAKKENLQPLEVQLRRMQDMVEEVHQELIYMRGREETHRNTNESTNSRVAWFSIFSLIWLICLGVWQVYYLKRYFRQKKLI